MKKRSIEVRETSAFPEVVAFMEAQSDLEDFKKDFAPQLEVFTKLIERYNATREQAEKVVRAAEVKCGPFDAYQVTIKYNAEELYKNVGRELFLQIGGGIGSVATYVLDKGRFEAALTAPGCTIPEAVVKAVRKESVVYHVPPELVLP
jgi:hypothetical protein